MFSFNRSSHCTYVFKLNEWRLNDFRTQTILKEKHCKITTFLNGHRWIMFEQDIKLGELHQSFGVSFFKAQM